MLNNSKVIIYPGVDNFSFWDSKRPWESLMMGCVVLYRVPETITNDYPIRLSKFCECTNLEELKEKMIKLYKDSDLLEKVRKESILNFNKFYTSVALSKYLLLKIHKYKKKK